MKVIYGEIIIIISYNGGFLPQLNLLNVESEHAVSIFV